MVDVSVGLASAVWWKSSVAAGHDVIGVGEEDALHVGHSRRGKKKVG